MFRSSNILRELQCPRKNHYYYLPLLDVLTTVGCFYAKSGDVAACRVVFIGLYLKSV